MYNFSVNIFHSHSNHVCIQISGDKDRQMNIRCFSDGLINDRLTDWFVGNLIGIIPNQFFFRFKWAMFKYRTEYRLQMCHQHSSPTQQGSILLYRSRNTPNIWNVPRCDCQLHKPWKSFLQEPWQLVWLLHSSTCKILCLGA